MFRALVLTFVYFVIVLVLSLVAEAFANLILLISFCLIRAVTGKSLLEPWFKLVLDHTSRLANQAADFIVSLARLVRQMEPFLWLTLNDDSGSYKNGTTMILSRLAKYKQK
ncbi:hypothetical protein ACE6H2_015442 [Prunus campanulata]